MRHSARLLPALCVLAACSTQADPEAPLAETLWTLETLDGAPFDAVATLSFTENGRISGSAPCNRYFGAVSGNYPDFVVGPLGASRRACPELDAEYAYLSALQSVTRAMREDDQLTLSDAGRPRLVFKRAD